MNKPRAGVKLEPPASPRANGGRLVATIGLLAVVVVTATAATADTTWARLPASAAEQLVSLRSEAALHDYGGFVWLELERHELARLQAAEVPLEPAAQAGELVLGRFRFDPLRDGEPELPPRLRARAMPRLWVVQLAGPPCDAWLETLRRDGDELLQYLPHNAYLVRRSSPPARAAASFVRWRGPYHPAYGIGPSLQSRQGRLRGVGVTVLADRGSEVTASIRAVGGDVRQRFRAQPDGLLDLLVVDVDSDRLEELAAVDGVVWLGDAGASAAWGGEYSSALSAGLTTGGEPRPGYLGWLADLGYDGHGVIWSIVDTGVDYAHPDLALVPGYSEPGCDTAVPGDDLTEDTIGHGTMVAGAISAAAHSGLRDEDGFFYGLGIAPGALLHSQCLCSTRGDPPRGGWQALSRRAVAAGASGSNHSWWTLGHPGYLPISRQLDLMVRDGDFDSDGVAEPHTLVFIAGNGGPEPGSVVASSEAKNVIVVGASGTNRSDTGAEGVAMFSSRGPTADGRISPTLVAPGEAVTTTRHHLGGYLVLWEIEGTGGLYARGDGTSIAAPQVSGAVAVITQWWRERHAADPSPAMARALLVNGAVPLSDTTPIPSFDQGWGRLHLGNVVRPAEAMYYLDQLRRFDDTGESWSIRIAVVDPTRPLKISLAWTDAAAAPEANPALVNDLDLVVETGGRRYLGNQFAAGSSVSGGMPDRLNTIENVLVAPRHGLDQPFRITVEAALIAGDGVPFEGDASDQDFALVCRNCRVLEPPRSPAGRFGG